MTQKSVEDYKPNCEKQFEASQEDENIAGELYDSFGAPFEAGNQVHRKRCVSLMAKRIIQERQAIKELRKDLLDLVLDDVPHKYQNRLLERLR